MLPDGGGGGLFFGVEADAEEEAVEKAKAVRDQLRDGLPLDAGEDGLDILVCTDGREVPTVQDIEDIEDNDQDEEELGGEGTIVGTVSLRTRPGGVEIGRPFGIEIGNLIDGEVRSDRSPAD